MEIAEVQDKESLKRYLEALPENQRREITLRLAFRAAARVLPVAVRFLAQSRLSGNNHLTPLPVFCAASIAGIAVAGGIAVQSTEAASRAYAMSNAAALDSNAAAADSANAVAASANAAINNAAAITSIEDAAYTATFHVWHWVRVDLSNESFGPLWFEGARDDQALDWAEAKTALQADITADWSFWIAWYERVLAGRDTLPDALAPIFNRLTQEDWEKGPAHINPMFADVLAMYRADDAGRLDAESQDRPTNHVKAIRTQVSALQEFLDAEYLHLTGHNARSPEQDEILELLKEMKALVADMISRLEAVTDNGGALIVVRENLPAIVERTGQLAVIEEPPVVSQTVATMSATIKSLVDAGADPELATKFAIGEAAGQKLWPRIKSLFGR